MLLYSFLYYVIGRYAVAPKLKAKGISEVSLAIVGLALIFILTFFTEFAVAPEGGVQDDIYKWYFSRAVGGVALFLYGYFFLVKTGVWERVFTSSILIQIISAVPIGALGGAIGGGALKLAEYFFELLIG